MLLYKVGKDGEEQRGEEQRGEDSGKYNGLCFQHTEFEFPLGHTGHIDSEIYGSGYQQRSLKTDSGLVRMYTFMKLILIEHLECARHWGTTVNKIRSLLS